MPRSAPAGRTRAWSTRCWPRTSAAARPSSPSSGPARRAEGPGPPGGQGEGDEKAALLARTKALAAEVKAADADQAEAACRVRRRDRAGCPTSSSRGCRPAARRTTSCSSTSGEPPEFDFEPLDHLELGAAARRHRHRARREGLRRAVLLPDRRGRAAAARDAQPRHEPRRSAAGFVPVVPPVLVKPDAMEGTGFLAQAAENVYHLPEEDLYLVGTSEVPLAAFHMDEVLDADSLPLRYAGWSTCFRREAGSYGKDTRGHHPGAPVRQDRDVLVRRPGRRRRPSTGGCWPGRRRCSPRSSCPTG